MTIQRILNVGFLWKVSYSAGLENWAFEQVVIHGLYGSLTMPAHRAVTVRNATQVCIELAMARTQLEDSTLFLSWE